MSGKALSMALRRLVKSNALIPESSISVKRSRMGERSIDRRSAIGVAHATCNGKVVCYLVSGPEIHALSAWGHKVHVRRVLCRHIGEILPNASAKDQAVVYQVICPNVHDVMAARAGSAHDGAAFRADIGILLRHYRHIGQAAEHTQAWTQLVTHGRFQVGRAEPVAESCPGRQAIAYPVSWHAQH
mgnify:CR=1 FL=1